jgi:hypothetical protein
VIHLLATVDDTWTGPRPWTPTRAKNGFILTGIDAQAASLLETSVPGIFAAGDVRSAQPQAGADPPLRRPAVPPADATRAPSRSGDARRAPEALRDHPGGKATPGWLSLRAAGSATICTGDSGSPSILSGTKLVLGPTDFEWSLAGGECESTRWEQRVDTHSARQFTRPVRRPAPVAQ